MQCPHHGRVDGQVQRLEAIPVAGRIQQLFERLIVVHLPLTQAQQVAERARDD